ncbi:hypothetical protein V493_01897 [Pseudogymnoascus sp. VKM F-4281 (FW-2241)]|nr:hypothetical protein V493_01897 [Pseudogymnoascus sp. VKM F-4281 (FW-2241)]
MGAPLVTVLVIGGTGAQGKPVVKELSADGRYGVTVLTRSAQSEQAKELASLPNVTILEGETFDEKTLIKAFKRIDSTFVNTNGFAIGEKAEVHWGIRIYEIAYGAGVKHFIWASLDYSSKLANFNPDFHCGHLDAKGKVADFLTSQPTDHMVWSILHSAPYLDTLSQLLRPRPDPDDPGLMVFSVPLGNTAMPLIDLGDLGKYAKWMFDHVKRSKGMTLKISTEHIRWEDLAKDYTAVTGRRAVYRDVTLEEYFASKAFPDPEMKVGHGVTHDDPTLQTYRENFSAFWRLWKSGLDKRDYELMDEIMPGRIRSVKEWMIKTGYTGEPGSVLKDYSDRERKQKTSWPLLE